MGNDDLARWNRPQGPVSGSIDAPLTPSQPASRVHSSSVHADVSMLKALKDTLRYLRSNSTDYGEFVDPQSYNSTSEASQAMTELLKEMEALKSRDASSATVLRMAKENLDKRKGQIAQLQEELANRQKKAGSAAAQFAGDVQSKDRQLQDANMREKAAQDMVGELETAMMRMQADIEARRQQDGHMQELLHEVEAQRDLHQRELSTMNSEYKRLLVQKSEEMDMVLQAAAQELEAVRAGKPHTPLYLLLLLFVLVKQGAAANVENGQQRRASHGHLSRPTRYLEACRHLEGRRLGHLPRPSRYNKVCTMFRPKNLGGHLLRATGAQRPRSSKRRWQMRQRTCKSAKRSLAQCRSRSLSCNSFSSSRATFSPKCASTRRCSPESAASLPAKLAVHLRAQCRHCRRRSRGRR